MWTFTSILIRFKSVESLEAEVYDPCCSLPPSAELSWSPSFFPLQSMVWIRLLHDLGSPSNYHFKHIPHLFALRAILTVIAMYFQQCTEIPQIQGQCWKPTTNLFTFNSKVPSDHRVWETSGTWRTSFEVRQIIELKLWFSVISGSMKVDLFFWWAASQGHVSSRDRFDYYASVHSLYLSSKA